MSTLVLLVGSNPLPNYLVACALQPRAIALVYTRETEVAKDRLKRELSRTLGDQVSFIEPDPFIEDATCATTIGRTLDSVFRSSAGGAVWLNYTGGTKVMAAHARMAFEKSGGDSTRSSYLDEGHKAVAPRLRYDDGRSTSLAEFDGLALNLQTVLGLHGIKHKPRTVLDGAPTPQDAQAILCGVLRAPDLAEKLYKERQRLENLKRPSAAIQTPFEPSHYGLTLSIQKLPHPEKLDRKLFESWYKFIGGEWLEEWVGVRLHALALKPSLEIVVGVNAFRGEVRAEFEVDVAALRGQRSYFISCTTDATKHICKAKLFEIAVRSRQLGGDLARAALICLADEGIVAALQRDIDDLWGATNTTKVFGLSDLRMWSDCDDHEPNQHTLRAWMES